MLRLTTGFGQFIGTYDKDFVVGRGQDADVSLYSPRVSRIHARFRREGGGWSVRDEGSLNGTSVNGVRLSGPATLQSGDVVRVAEIELVVLMDP